jgi:hypothetical protein
MMGYLDNRRRYPPERPKPRRRLAAYRAAMIAADPMRGMHGLVRDLGRMGIGEIAAETHLSPAGSSALQLPSSESLVIIAETMTLPRVGSGASCMAGATPGTPVTTSRHQSYRLQPVSPS